MYKGTHRDSNISAVLTNTCFLKVEEFQINNTLSTRIVQISLMLFVSVWNAAQLGRGRVVEADHIEIESFLKLWIWILLFIIISRSFYLCQMDFCSHQTATNALFEWFRSKIKGATENGNFFFMKNGYTKIFFSDPKSAVLT